MSLVMGIDSSTQSCKVLVVDADTGATVRTGVATHPAGTEVWPQNWWQALEKAIAQAGGLGDIDAVAVAGQQHGMVCLDADGAAIRPALLWNDTRSGEAARQLVADLGAGDEPAGMRAWAEATGSVPVASYTLTKLRWLADHEPHHADRIAAICLPHDWLTWRLSGSTDLADLSTDRSDASGTGYFDSVANEYRRDLLALGLRRDEHGVEGIILPRVLGVHDVAGYLPGARRVPLGPGCGDNAGAALALGLQGGDTSVSLGTSGVVAVVSDTPTADASGLVAGFADATGRWLPLACTLNGSRILDVTARFLKVTHDGLSELALAAEPGSGGLTLVPWFEGERTPNLPDATASLEGLTLENLTRENYARAGVEGLLCLLRRGLQAVTDLGVPVERVRLIGGAARSAAVQALAPGLLGVPVEVPEPGEYVALGAARQAAWTLTGALPEWSVPRGEVHVPAGSGNDEVTRRYAAISESLARRFA